MSNNGNACLGDRRRQRHREAGAEALAADAGSSWFGTPQGRARSVSRRSPKRRQCGSNPARCQHRRRRQQGRRTDRRQPWPHRSAGRQRRHQVPKRSWADMELEGWDKLVDINLNGVLYCMRAVLPAMRRQKDGCIHQRRILGRPPCLKDAGSGLHHDKTCGAGTDPFLQHGRMHQRAARLLPVAGEVLPDPEIAVVPPSEAEQAKMLQPEDCGAPSPLSPACRRGSA